MTRVPPPGTGKNDTPTLIVGAHQASGRQTLSRCRPLSVEARQGKHWTSRETEPFGDHIQMIEQDHEHLYVDVIAEIDAVRRLELRIAGVHTQQRSRKHRGAFHDASRRDFAPNGFQDILPGSSRIPNDF